MLYADLVQALSAEIPSPLSDPTGASAAPFVDPTYNTMLPRFIEYAELKMQRDPDLDFLAMRQSFASGAMTQAQRALALPSDMVIPLRLVFYTPFGTTPANGNPNLLTPVSSDFIDFVYSGASAGPPLYYAILPDASLTNPAQVVLGPAPDQAYAVTFYGTVRSTPLSSTNTSTFMSLYLPDLFFAAVMERVSAYQRNFVAVSGQAGASPQMTASWTSLYETLKKGAAVEEARKRAAGPGWQVNAPTPVATPPRS